MFTIRDQSQRTFLHAFALVADVAKVLMGVDQKHCAVTRLTYFGARATLTVYAAFFAFVAVGIEALFAVLHTS